LKTYDDEDLNIRALKDKKDAEQQYEHLSKTYLGLIEKTKLLSEEMRLYQQRLGIYGANDDKPAEETQDPLMIKLGLKNGGFEELMKKDYNYLLPLFTAYKHKLNTLDQHLTQRYRQVVRHDHELNNQLQIQQTLVDQIDKKLQGRSSNLPGETQPINLDYNFMGRFLLRRLRISRGLDL
jgi:hypothetical protein